MNNGMRGCMDGGMHITLNELKVRWMVVWMASNTYAWLNKWLVDG